MSNQFASTCYRCGGRVQPGEGTVDYARHEEKTAWPQIKGLRNVVLVQHTACAKRYAGTTVHYRYQPEKTE